MLMAQYAMEKQTLRTIDREGARNQ